MQADDAACVKSPDTRGRTGFPIFALATDATSRNVRLATRNPMWYKETIIYELHVRSFCDGDGDGVGDFKGLISRLDYLERLGVGALWLLPFYPSPLRDDGYDIADYTSVHPDYGSLRDFRRFLREAHDRGLKVITELVLNHTSDQHPWFQRARHAKPGSVHRDFYVWSDTPKVYREARIIFKDFEHSNWTWDPVAKAYFWHRFYSHQPDLNFDNPAVKKAVLKTVDFWLDMGVDGLRLDAVPYLYERRGTNCENLPETHAFLKELRAHVDANYKDRMLLAEANQWPEDAVSYFGDGDECHMAFHFPVMPRIFMSLWTEDRYPILDILEQTPDIPATSQWAIFLRNHDELTLEMVSDEERDYMYRAYATDTRARINLGIRRRLAPLMQNNRRRMEVINFLLFSFPGTPIVYYGDELGMGDNYHLGDRNGVRTPMQWSPDRNAGFSKANPQSLFLPVVIDPEYHYELVNVETQDRNQNSMLWWMRRLISTYKSLPALGKGRLEFVKGENNKVLSFLRIHESQRLLVLVNLSRYAQVAEFDLSEMAGGTPVEVFSQTRFPQVGKTPYVVTLGPHDHFWLLLEDSLPRSCPVKPVQPGLFAGTGGFALSHDDLEDNIGRLLSALLPWTPEASSFMDVKDARLMDSTVLGAVDVSPVLILAEARIGQEHASPRLVMPVVLRGEALHKLENEMPEAVVARLERPGGPEGLADGFEDPRAIAYLAEFILSGRVRHGRHGEFVPDVHISRGRRRALNVPADSCRLMSANRLSVCWSLGNVGFLKIFRRLEEGNHPELEMLKALARQDFPGVPRPVASLAYGKRRTPDVTLAVIEDYIQGAEGGQSFVDQALKHFTERVLATEAETQDVQALPIFTPPVLTDDQRDVIGEYVLDFFRRLGERTAALHAALARAPGPAFLPEPFTRLYLRSSYQGMRNMTHRADHALRTLARNAGENDPGTTHPVSLAQLRRFFNPLLAIPPVGMRIRIHGDFQLNNILHKGREISFVDFDGDVRLPLGERMIKRSPLRDVASMLVSVGLAAGRSKLTHQGYTPADAAKLAAWTRLWSRAVGHGFLQAYFSDVAVSPLLPDNSEQRHALLGVFLLEQLLRRIIRDAEEDAVETALLLDMLKSYRKVFE